MGIEENENENEVLEEEEVEFGPIEHPVEPDPDDDRPAKCPMPESCPLTVSSFRNEWYHRQSWF